MKSVTPSITEIAPDTYRISVPLPDALRGGFSFNQYLVVDEMPLDADDLQSAEPVYEELPGWEDSSDASVPPAAARFVERVSALAGIPIWVTSVGPARAQTLVSRNPFVA